MDSHERIETAIRLGKPDRVPVVPIIDFFAAGYGGISQKEMFFDVKKADRAVEITMRDLGRIDGQSLTYAGFGKALRFFFPRPPRIPGVDGVPESEGFQFVEESVMSPDEYKDIEEEGPFRWLIKKTCEGKPQYQGISGKINFLYMLANVAPQLKMSIRRLRSLGVESLVGYNIAFTPLEFISLFLRSFSDLVLDMFRRPDELKAASRALLQPMQLQGLALVKLTGVKRVFMGGARTSASFIGPRQFEEFALPEWIATTEYFVSHGITPILHMDSEWAPFFPYLKELPKRKCVLNLDGTSDIFKAKEMLGDHMCIMGDVPASLLKLGEPQEVDEYCRRLISELGADGGFILSSGCTIPYDAKPENVKAMLASVHRYGG